MALSLAEYAGYDALGLADLVRKGEVSSLELCETAWMAMEMVDPVLNFLVASTPHYARRQIAHGLPDGPFTGVPFLRKDAPIAMRGIPTDVGCFLGTGLTSNEVDSFTHRLLASGLVICGRSAAPSFSASITTEPVSRGPTRNPWNLEHSPAGSSGGAASAVASGAVPIAQAGDMGGSTRVPAHATGTLGFKPSRNLLPVGPGVGELAYGFSVGGVITRTVRDTAATMDAAAGPDAGCRYFTPQPGRSFIELMDVRPKNLRIAVNRRSITASELDPACAAAVDQAASFLDQEGYRVEEVSTPEASAEFVDALLTLIASAVASRIDVIARITAREPTPDSLEPSIHSMYIRGKSHTAVDLLQALDRINVMSRSYGTLFEEWDLLLEPVSARLAPKIGDIPGNKAGISVEEFFEHSLRYMGFSIRINAIGVPAIAVPWNIAGNGLPCSVQFLARLGADALCLQVARLLEQEHPWKDRLPPIHVSGHRTP